jgi:tetratricopeptide (TPR) repeat protein
VDPITRASRVFLEEAAAFWRAGRGPILPMVAGASARPDLVKTLRLAELAKENRRPLFLYEEPFTTAYAYGNGLAGAIAADYEAVRAGAEDESVALPLFTAPGVEPPGADAPRARMAWAIERAAALLAERLDGVLVALVPTRVEDAHAYRELIAALAETRFSPRVRLAVFHPPGGPLEGVLGGDGARFHVDPDELAEHLKQLGSGAGSAGPPAAPPPIPTEDQRRAFEAATGRRLPSPETARSLRALLLDAARATGQGDHATAAARYRDARVLCQREALALEEATVLLALGGACLAARTLDPANEAYAQAVELAQALEAWPVVCQAWLGAGGAELTAMRYEAAAPAYRAAADAAKRGGIAVLCVEALRMAGTCHLLRGAWEEAVRVWQEAVDAGAGLDTPARGASTFPQVTEALAVLLEQLGMAGQAAHVRSLVDADRASSAGDMNELTRPGGVG